MHFIEFIFDLFFTWCSTTHEPKNKKLKIWHKAGTNILKYVFIPFTIVLVLALVFL